MHKRKGNKLLFGSPHENAAYLYLANTMNTGILILKYLTLIFKTKCHYSKRKTTACLKTRKMNN